MLDRWFLKSRNGWLRQCALVSASLLMLSVAANAIPKTVELANNHYKILFESAKPGVLRIENKSMGRFSGIYNPRISQPFFVVKIHEADVASGKKAKSWTVSSKNFSTRSIRKIKTAKGNTVAWNMYWKSDGLLLEANLDIDTNSTIESTWKFTLKSNRELDATCAFPILDGLNIGPNPSDAWYFHPRFSGLLNDIPADLATIYGQYARMQVMSAYNPAGAGAGRPAGVYIVTHDTGMMRKSYELVKNEQGVKPFKLREEDGKLPFWSGFKSSQGIGMAVNWMRIALQTGKSFHVAPVLIGIGTGDWRDALKSYRNWAGSWYPVHNRSARYCFQHAYFDLFSQPNCDAALAAIDSLPYLDYMQFMVQNKRVLGDYSYRNDWSLAELQRFVKECKRRGIVTNHYVEGYIASETTDVWKKHGKEWGQMDGKDYQMAFANQCMWLSCPEWHKWLVGETSRLAKDLNLDSIYLDEVGWGTREKDLSDNPAHNPGRLQPNGAMTGARDLFRSVREGLDKINPGITMYTEGPAVDCLLPYLDGVEDYTCVQFKDNPLAYRIPIHFMRFVFPDFKFADIPIGSQDEITRQLRLCLFNGTGNFCMEGAGKPESILERSHVILRDNRDAFTDLHPTPLVPTMAEGLYCNRFSSAEKTVYTLFNANDYLVSGQVLKLPVSAKYHWIDVIRSSALRVDQTKEDSRAVMQIAPGDVAVIAAFPSIIKTKRVGERMWLTSPELVGNEKLYLDIIDRNGLVRERRPFTATSDGFSLADVTSMGKYLAAIKLYRDGVLRDVVALPDMTSTDLAEDADVTGSVRSTEAKVINGKAAGSYILNWDDKDRWVQYSWSVPQTFNLSCVRCANYNGDVYTPQIYRYLISDDGQNWKSVAEINREGNTNFNAQDPLPLVKTRFIRLEVKKGGLWADASEFLRWRIYCRPDDK